MTVRITVFSKQALAQLTTSRILINRGVQEGLQKAGLFVQNEVKESIAGRRSEVTSVDTGRFLNSVTVVKKQDSVVVQSEIPYAKSLEFNPSITGGPRMHFRNTASRTKQEVKRILAKEIRSLI